MAATALLAIGLGLAGYGAYKQYQGSKEVAAAQREATVVNQRNEALRQQQMNLDATRRRREVVRQALAARAASISAITIKGAGGEGSSAAGGAAGGISGRTNVNDLGIRQNQELGNAIFSNNSQLQSIYGREATSKSEVSMGSALSSFGGAIISNIGQINAVATTAFKGFKTEQAY